MRNILLILIVSLVSACAKKEEVPPLRFDTSYTLQTPTVASNGKRAYLIHGSLKYSRVQWQHPLFKPFVDGLLDQGFEVVTFDLPNFYKEYFHDGGLSYRNGFENQLRTIVENVELQNGPMENIVGGFSFGGLHSMLAQVIMPDVFENYFAILPVVRMDALTELRGINSTHFNPLNEVQELSQHKGLISYGNQDMRVNFNYTIELLNLLDPVNVTGIEYDGLAHTTTVEVVQDTLTWVGNL